MEKYDLSKISRDELCDFLSRAKDEIVKYTRCYEDAERVRSPLEEAKREILKQNTYIKVCIIICIICTAFFITGALLGTTGFNVDLGVAFAISSTIVGSITLFLILPFSTVRITTKRKIKKYLAPLPDLEKKEEEAFAKFFAVIEPYKFPRDYWYEYALTMMLKFVVNGQADSWKEVVKEYENHLHQMRMEENARQTLDEIKRQADDIGRGANAAQWAAAGAWLGALRR